MTPQEKNVFNKLFKTELGKHEIELAVIDNLRKDIATAIKIQNEFLSTYTKAAILKKIIVDGGNNYIAIIEKIQLLKDKVDKNLLDLGLNSNDIPETSQIEKLLASASVQNVKKVISSISQL